MDRLNQERSELLTLYREGLISKEALGEHLEQLANDSRRLKATLSKPPPASAAPASAAPASAAPAARSSHKLSDAEFDEVMGDLLAEDPEPEHKDELEHKEHEPAAEERKEGPTRLFHAEFIVQLFAPRADGSLRPGERRTMRGWAHLTDEQADQVRDAQHNAPVLLSPGETLPIAIAFGWGNTHENLSSEGVQLTITAFEEVANDDHEAGTWDAANVKLTRRGKVQPTLGCPAGRFTKAGGVISREGFYRDDSCMLSLFLETFADRLKTYREVLNLEGLYKMATGERLVEGQPAGVTLREAEKWLAHWRLCGSTTHPAPQRKSVRLSGACWFTMNTFGFAIAKPRSSTEE